MRNSFHILIIFIISFSAQSQLLASESNWQLLVNKDELTGKTSDPFLLYKAKILGTPKGEIQYEISCDVSKASGALNEKISIFNAPTLETSRGKFGYTASSRIARLDGSVDTTEYLQSQSYSNVFYTYTLAYPFGISPKFKSDYSDLYKKREFILVGGNKIIVEFGKKYHDYVKSCFNGKECAGRSVCGS